MEKIIKFFRVISITTLIAFIAAFVSCLFVPRTNYISYIDTDLIGVLFGLMVVVAGFNENNVFKVLSSNVIKFAKDTRKLALVLVLTVFFISMFITNDVALITFIPFTIMIYNKIDKSPLYVIVLQTIAANMGSALTPFGNPQNLFLFSASKMLSSEFFKITVPVTVISLVLLLISMLFIKEEDVHIDNEDEYIQVLYPKYLVLYAALFVLCILSVFNVVDMIYVFASVCVVVAIIQPNVFKKVDYGLLLTFSCFFIFVGNVKNIPQVIDFVSSIIDNHEFESAIITSQIISNVPAAVMLAAFTDDFKALILGTDIGGLGTIIASLASLITYKNYAQSENANIGKFFALFTIMNIIFLAVLYLYAKITL